MATVKLFEINRIKAISITESGVFLTFAPCESYNDRFNSEECNQIEGELNDDYSLVTLLVHSRFSAEPGEKPQALTFAYANSRKAEVPGEVYDDGYGGLYYGTPRKLNDTLLKDADVCVKQNILRSVRPVAVPA